MINSALATGKYFDLPEDTTALLCLPVAYIAAKMMLIRAIVLGWHIDVIKSNSNPLKDIHKTYDFSAMVPLQLENSLFKIDKIKNYEQNKVLDQVRKKLVKHPAAFPELILTSSDKGKGIATLRAVIAELE